MTPQFETACQKYYDRFIAMVRELGYNESVSMSVTDYGCSLYFFLGETKCRLSDHSVENTYRLQNENHYRTIDLAVLAIEKFMHPERFEKVIIGERSGLQLFKLVRK